jgi:SsrA-binding protein
MSTDAKTDVRTIATNRKARHEYFVEDTLEAGIVLTGTEIKSIRLGRVSLQEAYISSAEGEFWVLNMHIATYEQAHRDNHEPLRPRKLLLHDYEIGKWTEKAQQRGYTIIPLRLYLKRGRAKLEIALAKGKKLYDKREAIARRDAARNVDRVLSDHRRGRT